MGYDGRSRRNAGDSDRRKVAPRIPGFGAGTWLYRKSYDLTSLLDSAVERLLGVGEARLRRRHERLAQQVGDIRVAGGDRALISPEQVAAVARTLQPGDVVLTRKEWYLSNLAMPGYWKHSSVYVGTADERRRFFDCPEVAAWVRKQGFEDGCFESVLRARNPAAYATNEASDAEPSCMIESAGDGVCLSPLQTIATADSLAVLRPRLRKATLARAVARAFQFVGTPYDYLFDFSCDKGMICSEVVYKAYRRRPQESGLHLAVREISGRLAMPTNDLAKFYARRRSTAEQDLDLVVFLDGDHESGRAEHGSELDFARSWKRPVWRPFTGRHRANPPLLTGEYDCAE